MNAVFFHYIWEGPDKIKRNITTSDYKQGGLRMTDLDNFITALRITWIRRLTLDSRNRQRPFTTILEQYPLFWAAGANYTAVGLHNISNPFWREILVAWSKFTQNHSPPNKLSDCLNEPLWCNSHCRNDDLLIETWAKNGVLFLKDIINNEGGILSFREFKDEYKMRGKFLDYARLTKNIQDTWLAALQQTPGDGDTIRSLRHSPTIPAHLYTILKHAKGCRYAYDILNHKTLVVPAQEYWIQEIPELESVDWKMVYMSSSNCTGDTKLKEIHFRIVHKILTTTTLLFGLEYLTMMIVATV